MVQLPDQLFFNTGITTYIWIVNNKKKKNRKGKVQLIDGSSFYKQMKKSLGNKRKEISEEQRKEILKIYDKFEESEYCKIFQNEYFGYTKITIEQPTQPGMPNMKVIMYIFPILMIFFFNEYSAGLSYYYFISTLISIIIMVVIKRFFVDEEKLKLKDRKSVV